MVEQPHHTVLFRIDPTRNMRRFYSVSVQPNLFGGHSVMRNWGRIGTSGRIRLVLYDSKSHALDAQDNLVRSKLQRGYEQLNHE